MNMESEPRPNKFAPYDLDMLQINVKETTDVKAAADIIKEFLSSGGFGASEEDIYNLALEIRKLSPEQLSNKLSAIALEH